MNRTAAIEPGDLIFRQLPKRFARQVACEYRENYMFDGRRNANLQLLEHHERCTEGDIPLNASDDEMAAMAKRVALEFRQTTWYEWLRTKGSGVRISSGAPKIQIVRFV
jgi:hypothetical protein